MLKTVIRQSVRKRIRTQKILIFSSHHKSQKQDKIHGNRFFWQITSHEPEASNVSNFDIANSKCLY